MLKSLNLILAAIWLALGLGLLALAWSEPQAPGTWEYRELPGLLALAMALYNVIRWWSIRRRAGPPQTPWSMSRRRAHVTDAVDTAFQPGDEPPPVRLPPPPTDQGKS